jgi:transcriptional regulator
VHVAPVDRSLGAEEWRPFVERQGFGHLIAAGRGRDFPVVVPTQFILEDNEVVLHLVAANPIFAALDEQPRVVLSVAGDWAFIPSDWKVIGDEDPTLGIPTTYYAAVQLVGTASVLTEPRDVAEVLRHQLVALQPGVAVADPEEAHLRRLSAIRGLRISIEEVVAKFKYGGNVDAAHREAVIGRLEDRNQPGDAAAAAHTARRLAQEGSMS